VLTLRKLILFAVALAWTMPGFAQDAPAHPNSDPPLSPARQEADDGSNLPFFAYHATQPGQVLAVILSDAGGWSDADRALAAALSHSGVSVVGWDDRRYFLRAKTARQLTEDLSAVVQIHMIRWDANYLVVIGDGFGANLVPAIFERLDGEMPRQIVEVSLFGFTGRPQFQIGAEPPAAAATQADLAFLPARRMQCFHAAAESGSACAALPQGTDILDLPADQAELARQILGGLAPRPER
jgi:type IV secretory pathway VirJ component